MFIRLRLNKELETFFRGETEVIDFQQICSDLTGADDTLQRYALAYVSEKSNPLAAYMAQVAGVPFVPKEGVNDFLPECADHEPLHAYACEKATVLDDLSAVVEFGKQLDGSRHIAVMYHVTTLHDKTKFNLVGIRTRKQVFFYTHKQSRRFCERVGEALSEFVGEKKIFAFDAAKAKGFFYEEFKWTPPGLVDVRALAERNGIEPYIADIAKDMTGGHCGRAKNYTVSSTPSPMALWHIDIYTSIIYEFAVRYLDLRGQERVDKVRDDEERRARAIARNQRKEERRRQNDNSSDSSGRSKRPRHQ